MSKLIGCGASGLPHPFGYRMRDSDAYFYSASGLAYESYNPTHAFQYGIAASEAGQTGEYSFSDPTPDTVGSFRLVAAVSGYLSAPDIYSNKFWWGYAGPSNTAPSGIGAGWQDLVLPNGKSYAEAMEFIVAMVGGSKTSGAETSGDQTYVVRDLNDTTDLVSIENDGVGNRITITW